MANQDAETSGDPACVEAVFAGCGIRQFGKTDAVERVQLGVEVGQNRALHGLSDPV